jgi:hypothetical protein
MSYSLFGLAFQYSATTAQKFLLVASVVIGSPPHPAGVKFTTTQEGSQTPTGSTAALAWVWHLQNSSQRCILPT